MLLLRYCRSSSICRRRLRSWEGGGERKGTPARGEKKKKKKKKEEKMEKEEEEEEEEEGERGGDYEMGDIEEEEEAIEVDPDTVAPTVVTPEPTTRRPGRIPKPTEKKKSHNKVSGLG